MRMPRPSCRRKLLWLIGGRAAVITLLLGSAILIQSQAPGTLPIDPFFFLIGADLRADGVWALTLRFVGAAPLAVDVQLACDALIVSAHRPPDRRGRQLLLVALYAADHRRQHGAVVARRADGQRAELADLRRAGRRAVPAGRRCRQSCRPDALPPRAGRALHRRPERVRVHGGRGAERLPGRGPAPHRRAARGGVDAAGRPAGVQPARHRQPDERPGDARHRRAGC